MKSWKLFYLIENVKLCSFSIKLKFIELSKFHQSSNECQNQYDTLKIWISIFNSTSNYYWLIAHKLLGINRLSCLKWSSRYWPLNMHYFLSLPFWYKQTEELFFIGTSGFTPSKFKWSKCMQITKTIDTSKHCLDIKSENTYNRGFFFIFFIQIRGWALTFLTWTFQDSKLCVP